MAEEAKQDAFGAMLSNISGWMNDTFSGVLSTIFRPVDWVFADAPPWLFKFFAVGLFVATICWVMFFLKKEYVNLDQPRKGVLYDLRLWTLISMAPHMIIYWMWG